MGKVANSAIRKRRKNRADGLAKRAGVRADSHPGTEAVARRTRVAVAEVRRSVRTQQLAREAIDAADQRAAAAVRVLLDEDLTRPEIGAMCGVPLWTVRRLLALTPAPTPDEAPAGAENG